MIALRTVSGGLEPLDVARWTAPASAAERTLLADLHGPVLDVGCGPGRLVAALAERGVSALGIDVAPSALAEARRRGATVLDRSVFDPVPGEGRWATVLLLDGNVGIGGDPGALLERIARLLGPGGTAVVEVGPAGTGMRTEAAAVEAGGRRSPWFRWSWVGLDAVASVLPGTGLAERARQVIDGRAFVWLYCVERSLPSRSQRVRPSSNIDCPSSSTTSSMVCSASSTEKL